MANGAGGANAATPFGNGKMAPSPFNAGATNVYHNSPLNSRNNSNNTLQQWRSQGGPPPPGAKWICPAADFLGKACGWHNKGGAALCARRTCGQPKPGTSRARQTRLPQQFGFTPQTQQQQLQLQQQQQLQQRNRANGKNGNKRGSIDDDLLPPTPLAFADESGPQKWMALRSPDNSVRLVFLQGNNKHRNATIKTWRKQMDDEGAATFESSSLASLLDDTCIAYQGDGPATASSANTNTSPTPTVQITKLKAFIAESKAYGQDTERLEVKLQELEALPPQTGKQLTYNQAKEKARQAKAASDKQIKKVVSLQFDLEEETAKMHTAAADALAAETLAEQALAKELKDNGKQQSTLYIAKLLEGENPAIDLGGLIPHTDDPAVSQQFQQAREAANAAVMAAIAPLLALARASKQTEGMQIDQSNNPKRKLDGDFDAAADGAAKVHVGENGATPAAPIALADGSPNTTSTSTKPTDTATADASKNSGQATGKTGPTQGVQTPPPTPAQAAAAKKKDELEKRFAQLQASTRDTAVANAAAATAKAAAAPAGALDEDGLTPLDE